MRIRGAVLEESGRPGPYAESRPIWVGELDLDGPGPGELLVRIEAAGLCHSDLSVVDGNRRRPLPMLLGHEAAGRIDAVGEGVTDFRVGQLVTCTFLPRCGECAGCATEGRLPCEIGSAANGAGTLVGGRRPLARGGEAVHHHLGVSGFATHVVVNALSCVAMDDDVPAEVAALMGCAILTGGGAVLNAGQPAEGDTVVVLGAQERAIERGEWLAPEEVEARRPKVRTLQETYDRFLAQRPRPLALSTLTAYEQDWRLRIVPHWGAERDVKTVTHDDVWQWRDGSTRTPPPG